MGKRIASEPPDGGWGWLIVVGAFINLGLCTGTLFALGVLYVAFLDAFGESKAVTAWASGIYSFVSVIFSSVGVGLCKKFGHRAVVMTGGLLSFLGFFLSYFASSIYHLYVTIGIITAFGHAISAVPSVDLIGRYFKKKLSIALGFAMAGAGAGQCIIALSGSILQDIYGWRGMLLILSAIMLHITLSGALFRPPPQTVMHQQLKNDTPFKEIEQPQQNNEEAKTFLERSSDQKQNIEETVEEKTERCQGLKEFLRSVHDFQLFKDPVFILFIMTSLGQNVAFGIVIPHWVKRARDFGIGNTYGALLPAIMGISQLFGRPVCGALGNLRLSKAYVFYGIATGVAGITTIASIYLRSYPAQTVCIIILGVCMGGYTTLIPVVVACFFGRSKIGYGMAAHVQMMGIAIMCTSPLAGWMRDEYGDYVIAFWIAGCAFLFGCLATFLMPVVWKRRKAKQNKQNSGVTAT
ncbi:monocarboxylate transporter 12-like [Glandiceps talaboti]